MSFDAEPDDQPRVEVVPFCDYEEQRLLVEQLQLDLDAANRTIDELRQGLDVLAVCRLAREFLERERPPIAGPSSVSRGQTRMTVTDFLDAFAEAIGVTLAELVDGVDT